MTDQVQTPPVDPGAPPAPPPDQGAAPAAPTRPDWLPETFFDPAAGIKPEFGQHYAEVSKFYQTETEKREALAARKPDDIKFEVKLPEDVKVPEGMEVKIDENDPRVPIIREMAIEHGWDQPVIDKLVALDAKMKIEAHNAEVERVKAEDAKLGANGKERKGAITAWLEGFKDITAEERAEIGVLTATAAGVSLVEKLIAKSNGTVPGVGDPPPPPKPAEVPIEQRWYGAAQQKVS